MKEIFLTQGQVALVDDADYEWLNPWKWRAQRQRAGNFYAVRWSPQKKGKRFLVTMSRQILGLGYGDKRQADHQNHNTLNNCQSNLRICTRRENTMNKKLRSNTTSQFRGVYWNKQRNKWRASITTKRETKNLGSFDVEKDAARAYNKAAKQSFGEFALLNVII